MDHFPQENQQKWNTSTYRSPVVHEFTCLWNLLYMPRTVCQIQRQNERISLMSWGPARTVASNLNHICSIHRKCQTNTGDTDMRNLKFLCFLWWTIVVNLQDGRQISDIRFLANSSEVRFLGTPDSHIGGLLKVVYLYIVFSKHGDLPSLNRKFENTKKKSFGHIWVFPKIVVPPNHPS